MWYIIALLIASAGIILGFISCYPRNSASAGDPPLEEGLHPRDSIKKHLSRSELIEKMSVLAKKEAPKELSQGAMCYKVAVTPSRAEYICPVCHHKTIYTDNTGLALNRELSTCRSLAESMIEIECRLDESEFCRKCTPDLKEEPQLCIITRYKEETRENRVCGIHDEDLIVLREFFDGKLTHSDDYDYETPLKNKLTRISQLLLIEIPSERE